jgi:D-glucosaminate PTS system EIIB component
MISLVRVDDRLIHGQVVTQWISHTQANIIYIVDDTLANDAFMKKMLINLAPAGTVVKVVTIDAACENMHKVENNPELRAIILTNTPYPILRMVQAGLKFPKVVLGGMGAGGKRKRIFKTIAIDDKEKADIEAIIDLGVHVVCHIVPYTPEVDAIECLKSYK